MNKLTKHFVLYGFNVFISFVLIITSKLTPQDVEKVSNSICKIILNWIGSNHISVITICTVYLALSAPIFILTKLRQSYSNKRKYIKNMLTRINVELFESDRKNHRITLFKVTNWFGGLWQHFKSLLFHIRYPNKFWNHLLAFLVHLSNIFKGDKCLYIYARGSRNPYETSHTIFRVENNKKENVEGIVGMIVFDELFNGVNDLPDLSCIENLHQKKSFDELKDQDKITVKEYMTKGYIRNFKLMKRIHNRARHFYGTVIETGDNVWGVLLADSMSETSPFTDDIKKRFRSFSVTINEIIGLEV